MVLKQRRITYAALLFLLLLLMAACSNNQEPEDLEAMIEAPEEIATVQATGRGAGDTLRLLYWQAPSTLNPHLGTAIKDWEAARITYEPLASYDAEGQLVTFLAEEIPSLENGGLAADGRSVTWKLKPDVFWSDGEPFTADDVVFTYEFIMNDATEASTRSLYEAIESVVAVDDLTVRINFSDVNPAWVLPFVGINGMIIPEHVFAEFNGENAREAPANLLPVGTGPYRVVEYKPEEVLFLATELVQTIKIIYEPNPYFREEDKPYFSRIELSGGGLANEAARLVLQTGDVDFSWNLLADPATLESLSVNGHVVANFGPRVERILLNHTDPDQVTADGERSSIQFAHPFLRDVDVRRAISMAIDRDEISALFGLTGRPAINNLVSPAVYNSPNTSWVYDPDGANALLDELGWVDSDGDGTRDKDGVEMQMVIQTSTNDLRQAAQSIVKRNLALVGIDVQIRVLDASVFFGADRTHPDHYRHFSADMQIYRLGNSSPDPTSYMAWWTCAQIPQQDETWSQGENVERWCNAEYDALWEEASREIDLERRAELFIQMNDLLMAEVVMIPIVHRAQVSGVADDIVGLAPTPWDAETWNIMDWSRDSS